MKAVLFNSIKKMNTENPLFILPLLVGSVFVIAGFILLIFPPKKINWLYGYRTKSSMKNIERWNFAQKYSAKVMIVCGVIYAAFAIIFNSFLEISSKTGLIVALCTLIILVFTIFFMTERKLKNL